MEKAWAIIIDDDQAACMMAIPRLFEQLLLKRWQNNIPEYLISPLTTGFRKISIGVVKDSRNELKGRY
ncbi:hypothetical protein [Endozoicomonas atrinae]|uniref:hypothetical protein n=1 Tax=Endozoicomonas atrinae TaxID=1333660 RepID=UPI003B001C5F